MARVKLARKEYQEHELGYWAEKLGVSREQLRKAVQAAGPMVKDIRRHLSH